MLDCSVDKVVGRTLTLRVFVADGQSIAGMRAEALPRSDAFGLQFLVESTWTAKGTVDPRLQALADADPDASALRAAAPTFIERYTVDSTKNFPIDPRYNARLEIDEIPEARFVATLVVTDAGYLAHLGPDSRWDSPCGALFE